MYDKSTVYTASAAASAPRRSLLRTTVLALLVGLAVAAATFASAHASSPQPNSNMTAGILTAKTGTDAARAASDAVGRASQNRHIAELRFDLSHLYSDADEELFNDTGSVLQGIEAADSPADSFSGTELEFTNIPGQDDGNGAYIDLSVPYVPADKY